MCWLLLVYTNWKTFAQKECTGGTVEFCFFLIQQRHFQIDEIKIFFFWKQIERITMFVFCFVLSCSINNVLYFFFKYLSLGTVVGQVTQLRSLKMLKSKQNCFKKKLEENLKCKLLSVNLSKYTFTSHSGALLKQNFFFSCAKFVYWNFELQNSMETPLNKCRHAMHFTWSCHIKTVYVTCFVILFIINITQ